jgi:hypothetical protein
VATNIEEAADLLAIAQEQQRLAANVHREVIAMRAQLAGVADVLPRARQHCRVFVRETGRIGVETRRRRACAGDIGMRRIELGCGVSSSHLA